MADNGTAELSEKLVLARIDELLNKRSILSVNVAPDTVSDYQWVKESMRADNVTYEGTDNKYRFWGSADRKFSDTSLGGNFAINPRPQFTRYADPRSRGVLAGRQLYTEITSVTGNLGMGTYYSEAIDDTQQVIHVSCGVPEFNSFIGYFLNFYNHDAATMARSGRWAEEIGGAIGTALAMIVKVVFWKITLATYAITTIMQAFTFLAKKPSSKFYYFKPTMINYWSAVTAAVNQIATYKGMFFFDTDKVNPSNESATAEKVDPRAEEFRKMSALMPDIYKQGFIDGFIDVYAIANRTQRIKNYVEEGINDVLKNGGYDEMLAYTNEIYDMNAGKLVVPPSWKGYGTIKEAVSGWMTSSGGKAGPNSTNAEKQSSSSMEKHIRTMEDPDNPQKTGMIEKLIKDQYAIGKAEWQDGSRFATFRVDSTGSVDESWSNATRESDIQSKFNQISAQGRAASFSFAGGNIDGGVITAATDAVKGLVTHAMDGLGFGGLLGLAGGGFADIPKHWDNSSANMPRMNYTMKLISPYGNAMSQMINIYIPMCMLLAMALPLSTGKQSYTSPFVLEVYDKGRAQTRLGMVDSLTFVRGTSNLPFNRHGNFMSVDVSMSIADLSSVMHMPISNGFSLDPLKGLFDDDTIYSDYLNVLSAATLSQNVYVFNKLKLNLVNKYRSWQSMTSAHRIHGWIHEIGAINWLDALMADNVRGTN